MNKKGTLLGLVVLTAAGVTAVAGSGWLKALGREESTDDAFVRGDITAVSSRIPGEVVATHFGDNAEVAAGALLIELDARDYREKLSSANAQVQQAQAALDANSRMRALGQGDKELLDADRKGLVAKLDVARALVNLAQSEVDATRIVAPVAGHVGSRAISVGERIAPGQRLLAIVPSDGYWVDANFKETQLAHIARGQAVTVKLDAVPGAPLRGHVESLAPASGAEFSLLPAENASGNFTRVVQRVSVRVVLDSASLPALLRPGLSARVAVDTAVPVATTTASVAP